MNKFFVGFLVVVAGGVFGWFYLKGGVPSGVGPAVTPTIQIENSEAPQIDTMERDVPVVATTNVAYSDGGFSPAKVTIKIGTSVTFSNQSGGKMWVASDVHPTHQLLPGFDQLGGEAKGATYEYVFTKVGTWTYHNHVNPTHVATVVVTE